MIFTEAKQYYDGLYDEDAALLMGGFGVGDLDEAKQHPEWRAHVAIVNGKDVRKAGAVPSASKQALNPSYQRFREARCGTYPG